MIKHVYCIYDAGIEQYLTPFFVQRDREAKRGFIDAVNNPETDFYKWPEDYTLFKIGIWDQSTGMFTNNETIRKVLCAWEVIEKPPVAGNQQDFDLAIGANQPD